MTERRASRTPHLWSEAIAVGVSQHGQIIEEPQHGPALTELSGEQQQTVAEVRG